MNLQAIILDFDDTLVITNDLYMEARDWLFAKMREAELPHPEKWERHLEQADLDAVEEFGWLAPDCYPLAMLRTYRYFCEQTAVPLRGALIEEINQRGWQIHQQKPELIEGAKELLDELSAICPLYLITQGRDDVQEFRLRQSGLRPYFKEFLVTPVKDALCFRQTLAEWQLDPSRCWMIGNSIRSDINPALSVGMRAIHFTRSHWCYDREQPVGEYQSVDHLRDIPALICAAMEE